MNLNGDHTISVFVHLFLSKASYCYCSTYVSVRLWSSNSYKCQCASIIALYISSLCSFLSVCESYFVCLWTLFVHLFYCLYFFLISEWVWYTAFIVLEPYECSVLLVPSYSTSQFPTSIDYFCLLSRCSDFVFLLVYLVFSFVLLF